MMNTKMLYHDFLLKSVRLGNVNISNTPQFFILKCIWSLGTGRDWTSPHLLEACLGEQLQRTWALGREGRTDAPSTPEPGHRGWGQVAGDSGAYPTDSRPRAILFALRPRPCGCQTPGPARRLPLPGQKRSPRCCRRSLCVASSLCGGGGETWEQGLRPAPGAAKAGRETNVSEGQQLSATNCACTRVPAIVCPGGGSVGDPKSGRSGLGRPRRSPGQGLQPPILSRFPQRPGPASAQWLQCALLTDAFPFVSVSASLGISVSASLWLTLVSQHPSRAPGEQSWGGRAVGTGQRPVLTKDNEGRKGLEPRPGGLRAPGAPAPPLWRARHASALRTVRRVRPLRVEDPSCPVSPSRCPPSSPPAPGGTLPAGLHLRPSPASLTPASGAGGGCRGCRGHV